MSASASERETFWRLASASVSASVRRFGDFPVSHAGRGQRAMGFSRHMFGDARHCSLSLA